MIECWNNIILWGDYQKIDQIEERLLSIESGVLTWSNYHQIFPHDVSDVTDDDWGPKWFKPTVVKVDNKLMISGYSQRFPAIPFVELISEEWGVGCEIFYEEPLQDISGMIKWEGGQTIFDKSWTYLEGKFFNDEESFYDEIEKQSMKFSSYEIFLDSLNIRNWNSGLNLDFDKIRKIYFRQGSR